MTKEEIGTILKQLRLSCGKTQKEVAEMLGRKQQVIGHWETGYSQPDTNTLFTLCDLYGTTVDDAFGFSSHTPAIAKADLDFLHNFHFLDKYGQETILYLLNREMKRVAELNECINCRKNDSKKLIPEDIANQNQRLRIFPYLQKMASAGKSEYICSDISADTKEVIANDVADQSDYAVVINGNSMYPLYKDGDIVLVKRVKNIPVGKVGLFKYNNEIVIKRAGKDRLISDNHNDYKDIFPAAKEIECVGEVTGKLIGNEAVTEEEIEMLEYAASLHLNKPKTLNYN